MSSPAISVYAPISRNVLLQHPPKGQHPRRTTTTRGIALFLTLYYFLRKYYRNSPLLTQLLCQLSDLGWNKIASRWSWSSKLLENETVNGTVRNGVYAWGRITRALRLGDGIGDGILTTHHHHHHQAVAVSSDSGGRCDVSNHIHQIDSILNYWFGQNTPDKLQKQLWMIGSSSTEHLRKIDGDITLKFQQLLLDLSRIDDDDDCSTTRDLWCGKEDDTDDDTPNVFGWRGKLAAIIVLDQMSRHIRRHYTSSTTNNSPKNEEGSPQQLLPSQKTLDTLAHNLSQQFQQTHATEISSGMIPIPMYIFSLMPLRHASTIASVGCVQAKVEELDSLHSGDLGNMIRRFRRATTRRMAVLQDDARREGRDTKYTNGGGVDVDVDIDDGIVREVADNGESTDNFVAGCSDDDILEEHPFAADMTSAKHHPVVRTMIDYLSARGIHPIKRKSHGSSSIERAPLIVSLSGGVDSMVIANVLAFLRDTCGFSQLYIVAAHIDYGNRPESSIEASYVSRYSTNTLKLDDFVVRVIQEVTRGITARDAYEKISRTARYDLYRTTVGDCIDACSSRSAGSTNGISPEQVGVMLGHHCGDLVENVLSNAHKGNGPLNLSGMTAFGMNDGVAIYRPLLTLDKVDIYDYAHKFGVPYFKDTTPHWSTRGKLRNKLLPLLEEIYGDGCMSNLATLAKESDEARALLQGTAFQPFMEKVERTSMGIIFHTTPFKEQGPYFWKNVLRNVLHSAGRGMFGDKTITSFLERVLADTVKQGWLQCRKDYAVYLNDDGRVFILHPESFPWNKRDYYDCVGQVVVVGKNVSIGPWLVSTEEMKDLSQDKTEVLLQKKAIQSWDKLMEGYIEYCVKVPLSQLQEQNNDVKLVFIKEFTRESRPTAWKNIDLRVQSTLPLLGIDDVTLRLLSTMDDESQYNPSCVAVIKVIMKLK